MSRPGLAYVTLRSPALARSSPPRMLTNADFETLVDTTDEWILKRTGIRE